MDSKGMVVSSGNLNRIPVNSIFGDDAFVSNFVNRRKESSFNTTINNDNYLVTFENIYSLSTETASAVQQVSSSAYDQKIGAEQLAEVAKNLNQMAHGLNKALEAFRIND